MVDSLKKVGLLIGKKRSPDDNTAYLLLRAPQERLEQHAERMELQMQRKVTLDTNVSSDTT
jgi:hypothetical protein